MRCHMSSGPCVCIPGVREGAGSRRPDTCRTCRLGWSLVFLGSICFALVVLVVPARAPFSRIRVIAISLYLLPGLLAVLLEFEATLNSVAIHITECANRRSWSG